MSDNSKGSCPTCANSIRCETWTEFKCLVNKHRYSYSEPVTICDSYEKRGSDFKESKCQCEDCLTNVALAEEYLEED